MLEDKNINEQIFKKLLFFHTDDYFEKELYYFYSALRVGNSATLVCRI